MQMSGPLINTTLDLGVTLKWYNTLHLKKVIKRSVRDCIIKGIFKIHAKTNRQGIISVQAWWKQLFLI